MRLFHGGKHGLNVGDELLPPSVTRSAKTLLKYARNIPGCTQRADRVYLTTDPDAAFMYAAMHPDRGAVYEVEANEIEPDPDCTMPGLSWQAPKATIVAVLLPRVSRNQQRACAQALGAVRR